MNGRAILMVLLAVVAALILVPVLGMGLMLLAGSMGGMMGPGGMGGMMGPGGMGGMMSQPGAMMGPGWLIGASWLLVGVGVILLLLWSVRRLDGRGSAGDEEAPLAILQRRYARGEIGPEEYERIRADLLRDRSRQ